MKPETVKEAQEILHSRLVRLDPVGASGFEGFMAKVLSEFTGQNFYVAKSGHQKGSDARSEPGNLFKIGMEGKRFNSSTRLSLDGLLAKITDASTAAIPVDLLLFAVTRGISVSDREKLHEYGEKCGVGIGVFDWPDDQTDLCELAVLCTSAPIACKNFLNSSPLSAALKIIRQNPRFDGLRLGLLEKLTQADVGYRSTALKSERWIEEAQCSLANAKSRLGGHHNLGEVQHEIISRATINAQIDEWYLSNHSIVALLGKEGMGKSWTALEWYNQLKSSELGAPLTIFLNAKSVDTSDIKSTLAKKLAIQTDSHNTEFWEKRLTLWERFGGAGVNILIFVDGLNENFGFKDWATWLQPLFEENLGGMYRVILTCWSSWWSQSLVELANLVPQPKTIEVTAFDDVELNCLLDAMHLSRPDISEDVLELMRVPRLSALVAKHRDKLKDSSDVTAERVIYEDWKDRIERQGHGVGLTDPEMKTFIVNLGEKLKEGIDKGVTRGDIVNSLIASSGESGLEIQSAVAALISGGWFQQGDEPNTFKVVARRIPFALGAALISQIRTETDATTIETKVAIFLDPLKAHSLGADILRSATTISIVEPGIPAIVRTTLLSRWLDEQNFHTQDFEAFWRLAGCEPDAFLDFAEKRWLNRIGGHFDDEILIKALANAAEFGEFRRILHERLTKWLAVAWPDPMVGAILGEVDQTAEDSQKRSAETASRYSEWICSEASRSFSPIQLEDNPGWSWLGHRALAILSYLERSPFISIFETWAVSRAIMGWPRHEEEIAWLLRLNSEDPINATKSINERIAQLEERDNPICGRAATYLKVAISHVSKTNDPLTINQDFGTNPPPCLNLDNIGVDILGEIYKVCFSPFGWRTYGPDDTKTVTSALTKTSYSPSISDISFIHDNIFQFMAVLSQENRSHLRKIVFRKQTAPKQSEEDNEIVEKIDSVVLSLQLYDATPAEQSALILSSNANVNGAKLFPAYRFIKFEDIARLDINNVSTDSLANWLDYVARYLPQNDVSKLAFLKDLVCHDKLEIRYKALYLALYGHYLPALKAFSNSPLSRIPSENREHECWRNLAILEACSFSPDGSTSSYINPESYALIVEHCPDNLEALDKFNEYLEKEFLAMYTANSWGVGQYWYSHKKAIDVLIEHDLNSVLEWLEPMLENPHPVSRLGPMNDFPAIDIMRSLSAKVPQIAINIYHALRDQSKGFKFFSDVIEEFPFEIYPLEQAINLCDELTDTATSDKVLLEIAYSAHKHGCLDWLFNCIEHFEASSTPADVAKAYTLLGACDDGERSDKLWERFLDRPPSDDWLKHVLVKSVKDYKKNGQAKEALKSFWLEDQPSVAWRALQIVKDLCDIRLNLWMWHVSPDRKDQPYDKRFAINVAIGGLQMSIKRDRDSRAKELFHTPIGFSVMAPWT